MATKATVIGLGDPMLELDSEGGVTKTEEVTKTKGDKRVSNSIRGQGSTALYETYGQEDQAGDFTVVPRPYLYYWVGKGSIVRNNRGARATYESEL